MVTNAKIPGKYKPKKNTSDVATPPPAPADQQETGNKGDNAGGENATETDEKKPKK